MNGSRNRRLLKATMLLIFVLGLAVVFTYSGGMDVIEACVSGLKQLRQVSLGELTSKVASRPDMDREVVYQFKLARISSPGGLQDLNSTDKYVEEVAAAQTGAELQPGQISYYQTYVTPNDPAVQAIAKGKGYEAIYQEAASWVWVEDMVLNGVQEKWLPPNYFLTQSPGLASNPVKGSVASDCEEQAYTLVSALRAAGMQAENVRVVTGQVNFGGSAGGHAWVEVFDESISSWFQLDPTSGGYYDSASKTYHQSRGLPYTFFKTYQYPSVQIWNYFNDKYFWDNNRQQGTVAKNWLTTETVAKQAPESEVIYQLPDSVHRVRVQRVKKLQEEAETFDQQELLRQLEQLRREREQQENQAQQEGQSKGQSSEQSQRIIIPEQQGTVAAVGRVTKIDDNTITMSTRFGALTIVYSSETIVNAASPESPGTIELDAVILVQGKVESAERIQAESIYIFPSNH